MAHVLLLEPDRMLARTYEEILHSEGHTVSLAASAQAAISRADELCPDVAIVELQLVNHSGIEFLYEFRSYTDWLAIPVIALTHVPPAEFRGSWQLLKDGLGVKTYLYKPHTSLRTLIHNVNDVLSLRQNV